MPFLASALARRTVVLLLAGLLTLAAIIAISLVQAQRTRDQAEAALPARTVRLAVSTISGSMLTAESAQRGYLLTGEAPYLEPFEAAIVRADEGMRQLYEFGDEATRQSADRLQPIVKAKFDELKETIRLAETDNRVAALALVRTDRGLRDMQQAQALLDEIRQNTDQRVLNALVTIDKAAALVSYGVIGAAALLSLFALTAAWVVNRYTRELVTARHEVETLNRGLEERVAERTSALQRANDEIQRFAYIVSHDLRSPLVNIMGFTSELEVSAEMLARHMEAPSGEEAGAAPGPEPEAAHRAAVEDIPEAVRFIRASTQKMDGLINAILRLSREGRRDLNPAPVDLRRLFETAAASVKHQLDQAGATLTLPATYPTLVSDRLALEQIFGNLIDNAVKYLQADRPGRIEITARYALGRVRIAVEDNGRGIAPQDHERIFELFRRSGAQDQPGEGIGLAHVRALARRLGGDVAVVSDVGRGTRFDVDLPQILKVKD